MDRFFALELSDAERDALAPNSPVRHRCGICPTRAAQGDFGESQMEASKLIVWQVPLLPGGRSLVKRPRGGNDRVSIVV